MKRETAFRSVTRRDFLKSAVGAAGAVAAIGVPYVITSSALGGAGKPAASDRVVMGCIGVGGQGSGDMGGFLGFSETQVVAVCDVDPGHRNGAKGRVDGHYKNTDCKTYNDLRELVVRGDIDAMLIATPDHWHALASIWAMRNGKDVYCEKPLSLTIAEGRAMVETARRYGRVFSCGSQRVRGDYGNQADYVDSGAIGEIKEIYVNVGGPSRPCDLGGEPIPEGFDWEMWLGPAPWAPYNRNRCSAAYGLDGHGFRTWEDYSGGMMTDWGGHNFGGAMYGARIDDADPANAGPVEVIPPDKDHPMLTYKFASGVVMYHSQDKGPSIRYVGTLGEDPGKKLPPQRKSSLRQYHGTSGIFGDFLNCVATRRRPFQDVEYAHRTATVCHLGNIAYRLKRPLKWDPVKEIFPGDEEATRLVDRPKREPWRL
jgi:hypothetical protein